jgi:prepilin-type N-terminal cleavage/methylation domain-containing protein
MSWAVLRPNRWRVSPKLAFRVSERRGNDGAGFTLVELLVVIAIIGMLTALLLPAVQAARESTRRTQCTNNVRQMAEGFLNHESAHGHFPTGGWGYEYVGEPDSGFGPDQPGSWAYNLLAFIEQPALRQAGAGIADIDARQEQVKRVVTNPLSIWHCPSKRTVQGYPMDPRRPALARNLYNCGAFNDCHVARGDYRANGGNKFPGDVEGSPPPASGLPIDYRTGISYMFSTVRVADVTDGASRTIMLGERAISSAEYFDGSDTADDQSIYSGHDNDNVGFMGKGLDEVYAPQPDTRPASADLKFRFGGPHDAGFIMARCDGSATLMAFEIEPQAYWLLGGRNDEK